jgi:hypothetical protein
LILTAIHINDPQDQPGRIELQFQDQKTCEQALSSLKWQLKFKNFKVVGECKKQ